MNPASLIEARGDRMTVTGTLKVDAVASFHVNRIRRSLLTPWRNVVEVELFQSGKGAERYTLRAGDVVTLNLTLDVEP